LHRAISGYKNEAKPKQILICLKTTSPKISLCFRYTEDSSSFARNFNDAAEAHIANGQPTASHQMLRFGRRTIVPFFIAVLLLLFTSFCILEIRSSRATVAHLSIHSYVVRPEEGANSSMLPHLDSIPWPNVKRPNVSTNLMIADLKPFDVKLSPGQYASMERLLDKFEQVMISLKLQDQWFLGAGSLLGSLQHHDLIPWDDDLDVGVHLRYRPRIRGTLKHLQHQFKTYAQSGRDKLFFKPFAKYAKTDLNTIGSHSFSHLPWAWPFIDIFYYREIDSVEGEEYTQNFHKFKLSDIFPLTCRPFGKHWYPAPRRPVSFLRSYYSTKRQYCSSHDYSHALEKLVSPKYMDCRELMERYAFVHRCPIPEQERNDKPIGFCDEHLVDGSGRNVHMTRLTLDSDEIDIPLYAVRHEAFKCP
uniref:Lipopolysaccharide choline phosphotransferase n=1 Tax=Taenia asiatica TaxID=60517 RepID=A0A0R3WFZ7_TAEAS